MKLLIDMNLSPTWVETFARTGIEAVHWSALGAANASDVQIMAYAKFHNYVVLTHDLDFSTILAATKGDKPSVVQIRTGDIRPKTASAKIISALKQMEAELDGGALLTIHPDKARLRLLPLLSR